MFTRPLRWNAAVAVVFGTFAFGSSRRPQDKVEDVIATIKRSGGSVNQPETRRPKPLVRIRFVAEEASAGRLIEPGLRALERLPKESSFAFGLSLEGAGIVDASLAHVKG